MKFKQKLIFGSSFVAMWALCTWLAITLGNMV